MSRKIANSYTYLNNFYFIDIEKTERHAEKTRDKVIKKFKPKYITYLCDDDLFLDKHLEVMELEIQDFDFVHPQPVFIDPDKNVRSFFRTNLEVPESIQWHLNKPYKNSISLSGVTHTLESYLSLPYGWRNTPVDRWTDHYMWEQFFLENKLKFKTSKYSTTIKLPAEIFNTLERSIQIKYWFEQIQKKDFFIDWNDKVRSQIQIENVKKYIEFEKLQLSNLENENRIKDLIDKYKSIDKQLQNVYNSKSWKLTKFLRTSANLVRNILKFKL